MPSLTSRRDPVRLALSRAPWASFWYLFGYLFIGAGLCAVVLSVGAAGAALGITLAGLPVLISAALVIRRCADAERTRLRLVTDAPARARYRAPSAPGLLASLRVRWTDPVTWRDIAYLAGLYLPLAALDLTVVTVWLSLLAGITLPAWYWAPWQSVHGVSYHGYPLGYFPNGPHGHPGWGLYVDSLPKALLTALVCLAGFLLFNYVLVATARAHAHVARSLLSDPVDPLEEAKEILRGPGPLSAAEAASHPVFREQCLKAVTRTSAAYCPAQEGPALGRGPSSGLLPHSNASPHHREAVQKELSCASRAVQYPPRHRNTKRLTRQLARKTEC